MSDRTRRSGTSSGVNSCSTQTSRIKSMAIAKFVEPPQGAFRNARTFSTTSCVGSIACQRGCDSKVRTRFAKAGAASSATTSPSAMATSIGVPCILPDTSTSATTFPRSVFLSADVSICCCSRTARSTSSTTARHWAWSRSCSSVDACDPNFMAALTTSCGNSCLPLTLFFWTRASRTCLRHATLSGSSGNRSPVSTKAPDSGFDRFRFSLRNACRLRARQSDGTPATSIEAQRLPHIFVSVVPNRAFKRATSCRYFFFCSASPGNKREASTFTSVFFFLPSRGAYLASKDTFFFSSASSSRASWSSWRRLTSSATTASLSRGAWARAAEGASSARSWRASRSL
mmetsp:Transcript_1833/g.5469  ORF Transcript_1833/g.5469 Transcript_1833/m.5469 type:complete len:344 (-) Transcript_1833:367-1398(-)